MVIVVFGVTGAGKTRIGGELAQALGWMFIDADDLHDEDTLAKLKVGTPLSDADRWPWLARLREVIGQCVSRRQDAVVACSALKRVYRHYLRIGPEVVLVYLRAEVQVLEERLKHRMGHFMNPGLLESQLDTLEEPIDGTLAVDTARSPVEIVDAIRIAFNLQTETGSKSERGEAM